MVSFRARVEGMNRQGANHSARDARSLNCGPRLGEPQQRPHRKRTLDARGGSQARASDVGLVRQRTGVALVTMWLALVLSAVPLHADHTALLNQWLAAQANLRTWSADLTQTRHLKTLAQPLVSTGQVWFAAPNQFRWEIGSPAQTIAVRGEHEMLVIYPRLKRVERYPIGPQAKGPWKDTLSLLEAGFPRSRHDLERQFKVLAVHASGGECRVTLEPRSSSARRMMPGLESTFATNDFALRATELQFADGSRLRNEFRNGVVNPEIAPERFDPKIDPEFRIVEPVKR